MVTGAWTIRRWLAVALTLVPGGPLVTRLRRQQEPVALGAVEAIPFPALPPTEATAATADSLVVEGAVVERTGTTHLAPVARAATELTVSYW
jgi:hypothetical protein